MAIHDFMYKLILIVFFVMLAACQGESAPQVPAEVRAAVVRQLAEVGSRVDRIDHFPELFKPVNLSSQAAPDWLVDFSVLPSGQFCGTGGCPLQVWVKLGSSPYVLAFDRQTLGHEVARHDNGRRWLTVELHGVLCGGTGSDPCTYHFEWHRNVDVPDGYFSAVSIWGKPLRYEGPLVQALPLAAPIGSPMAMLLDAWRSACVAAGGVAGLDEALVRLPDLNRDGRPEWLFDASQADCQRDDEIGSMKCTGEGCRSKVFTEHGGQGWHAVWSDKSFDYAVDFSQPEPRLMMRPLDCDGACPERSLLWLEDKGRFSASSPIPLSGPSRGSSVLP